MRAKKIARWKLKFPLSTPMKEVLELQSLPDKTLTQTIMDFCSDKSIPQGNKWNVKYRVTKSFKKLLQKKIAAITLKEVIDSNPDGNAAAPFSTALKYAAGLQYPTMPLMVRDSQSEIKPTKIKHFVFDESEAILLLKQRNSRFAELITDVAEQLKILEPGKSHGFYPGTEDKKEIQAIITALHETCVTLGFKARYIKSKGAIILLRQEILNPKNGKVKSNGK